MPQQPQEFNPEEFAPKPKEKTKNKSFLDTVSGYLFPEETQPGTTSK
jgi:hypothetical protein